MEGAVLNHRRLNILNLILKNNGTIQMKELMKNIDISERTLRNEIDRINYFLVMNKLEPIDKIYGGKLVLNKIQEIKTRFFIERPQIELSSDERGDYIILFAIFNKFINLHELSDELGVSRTTIVNYYRNIRKSFSRYDIKFNPAHKKGVELMAKEEDIRLVLLKLYNKYSQRENNFIVKYIESHISIFDNLGINNFMDKIQQKMEKTISDEAFRVITGYLKILIFRIKNGFYINKINNENFLINTTEYSIVMELSHELGEFYKLEINHFEILKILDFILGSHTYNYNTSYFENWIEVELLIKKIILNFSNNYGVNLNNDKMLLEGLINHIKPTIHRLKNKLELENKVYEDVSKNYNDILQGLSLAITPLEEHLKMEISKEELSFLALHFKVALDKKLKKDIKNVLVVCTYGYGSSKLLAQQLKDNFSINIVDIIPFNRLLSTLDKYNIDLIISTIDIPKNYFFKSIKVNTILSEEDLSVLVKNGLSRSKRKFSLKEIMKIIEKNCSVNNYSELKIDLLKLFEHRILDDIESDIISMRTIKEEMIGTNVQCNSWEEAIKESGKLLKKQNLINDNYINDMINNIEKYGGYIVLGDKVAIPHAKATVDKVKTGYGILKLKEPVIFPNNKKVDILIPFSSKDGIEHLQLLSEINLVLSHEKFTKGLRELNSKIEIKKYIRNYLRES